MFSYSINPIVTSELYNNARRYFVFNEPILRNWPGAENFVPINSQGNFKFFFTAMLKETLVTIKLRKKIFKQKQYLNHCVHEILDAIDQKEYRKQKRKLFPRKGKKVMNNLVRTLRVGLTPLTQPVPLSSVRKRRFHASVVPLMPGEQVFSSTLKNPQALTSLASQIAGAARAKGLGG